MSTAFEEVRFHGVSGKVVRMCASMLVLGAITTFTLQTTMYVMSEGNGVYTWLSTGYWSGLSAIAVAIQALITDNQVSRGKLTALLVLCVAHFFVSLAAISNVIVAAYDSDYCLHTLSFYYYNCDAYAATYLGVGVVSALEIPFLMVLAMAAGMCTSGESRAAQASVTMAAALAVSNQQQQMMQQQQFQQQQMLLQMQQQQLQHQQELQNQQGQNLQHGLEQLHKQEQLQQQKEQEQQQQQQQQASPLQQQVVVQPQQILPAVVQSQQQFQAQQMEPLSVDTRNPMGMEPMPRQEAVIQQQPQEMLVAPVVQPRKRRDDGPKPGRFSAFLSGVEEKPQPTAAQMQQQQQQQMLAAQQQQQQQLRQQQPTPQAATMQQQQQQILAAQSAATALHHQQAQRLQQQQQQQQQQRTVQPQQQQQYPQQLQPQQLMPQQVQQQHQQPTQQQQQQQQQQQNQNTMANLGMAALSGAVGATAIGEMMGVGQGGGGQQEQTVAQEFVGEVAGAAVTAGLDALQSGEFDPSALGEDLAGAGVGAIGGALAKNKKLGKFGKLFG